MTQKETINVIVVGGGFGGVASAIELTRKGCKVKVYEAAKTLTKQGDVIMIGSNATRIIKNWGDMLPQLVQGAAQPSFMVIRDQHGKPLLEQPMPPDYEGHPNLFTNRGKAHNLMMEYAESLGVEFTLGARISEYFEEADAAGFIADGKRHSADLVIGADGVHSRAREFVTQKSEKAQKSGFAVYRSWFSLDELEEGNPKTDWLKHAKKDLMEVWIGENIHSIVMVNTTLNAITCFVTHKDTADIAESWNLPGNKEDMIEVVKNWDPTLKEVIKCIPPSVLIDWKMLWRNPVKQWVSDGGRVALVGDAAHPHLATSGTGAAQAFEDAASIGALLDVAGKKDIPLALRVYQKLRFERTSITQRMGWETRHRWHQTDWEALATNPEILRLPQPGWLHGADAEKYAYENFEPAVSHLEKGTPFTSTNVPKGHKHEDWTIQTMMANEGMKGDFYLVDNTAA